MKNIHILPTKEKSKLYKVNKNLFFEEYSDKSVNSGNQHIYITSKEEITGFENNIWVIKGDRIFLWQNTMALVSNNKPKKIILTTDQNLIENGIQAIDDEFLQWFAKNPSREEVEIKHIIKEYVDDQDAYGYDVNYYKITIPLRVGSEVSCTTQDKETSSQKNTLLMQYPLTPDKCFKQETDENLTAEQIAWKWLDVEENGNSIEDTTSFEKGVEIGAKWQAERMYSEEEVKEIVSKLTKDCYYMQKPNQDVSKWFEKFKKK